MLAIVLRIIAFLLFLVAAISDGGALDQTSVDLIAFGLAAWVLSILVVDFDNHRNQR